MRQPSQQALADFACSPMGFIAPSCDDCRLDWFGQLVGVPKRPAGPIAEPFQTTFLIPFKDLVTGLSRNTEPRHRKAMLSPSLSRITKRIRSSITEHSLNGMFYILPRRKAECVTHVSGTFCYLCVGTVTISCREPSDRCSPKTSNDREIFAASSASSLLRSCSRRSSSRTGFTKATVSAWRVCLEARGLKLDAVIG